MKKNWKVYYGVMLFLAFLNMAVYWSMKPIWFFINQTLGAPLGTSGFGALLIFFLSCTVVVYILIRLAVQVKKGPEALYKFKSLHVILPVLLTGILTALNAFLYGMLGSDTSIVPRNLLSALPFMLAVGCSLYFVVFYPDHRLSKKKSVRYLIATVFIAGACLYFIDFGNVAITSGPYVQFLDDGQYAIMWTTNKNSTGWVEYGTSEEAMTRVQTSENGLVDGNTTVHKVILPLAPGDEGIYRVGSTKTRNIYQNNVEYGNTVTSDYSAYAYDPLKEETSFYILSDVHEKDAIYESFLSEGDYDFFVLNGDILSSIDDEKIIVDEMLKPITNYTEGEKPFYFVRGNHETRGAEARSLPDYLALPDGRYYYTFSYGPVFAIVLDTGEDKLDDHEEYGGLADFESYREIETAWLASVAESDAYKEAPYRIAFSHVPLNAYGDLEEASPLRMYEEQWVQLLNDMELDVLFSGHTHENEIVMPDPDAHNFPIIIGGGHSGDGEKYVGIKVVADQELMSIDFIDEEGAVLESYWIRP